MWSKREDWWITQKELVVSSEMCGPKWNFIKFHFELSIAVSVITIHERNSKWNLMIFHFGPKWNLMNRVWLCQSLQFMSAIQRHWLRPHCNTLQHTAIHCNTRQHAATQWSKMEFDELYSHDSGTNHSYTQNWVCRPHWYNSYGGSVSSESMEGGVDGLFRSVWSKRVNWCIVRLRLAKDGCALCVCVSCECVVKSQLKHCTLMIGQRWVRSVCVCVVWVCSKESIEALYTDDWPHNSDDTFNSVCGKFMNWPIRIKFGVKFYRRRSWCLKWWIDGWYCHCWVTNNSYTQNWLCRLNWYNPYAGSV